MIETNEILFFFSRCCKRVRISDTDMCAQLPEASGDSKKVPRRGFGSAKTDLSVR